MKTIGESRKAVLWLLVLGLVAFIGLPTRPVGASCAAPTITLTPATGAPGSGFVVKGQYFADGCNDVIVNGQQPEPAPPAKGIAIVFQQNGRNWNLGTVDADADYTFSFPTAVPLAAKVGGAVVTSSIASADFTVTASRPATPVRREPSVTG